MKIKRRFVGGIAALVFASGLAFFAAIQNLCGPADIGGRTKMNIEKCLETLPASLDKTHMGVMAAMDSLSDCVSKTGDSTLRSTSIIIASLFGEVAFPITCGWPETFT